MPAPMRPLELRRELDRLRRAAKSAHSREVLYQASQWIEAQTQRNIKIAALIAEEIS